ncbi:MAG: UDP-N-acetylglucosamine 1-carboxyvinyltransferase [Chloroflexota bacterium]|nr:UDP-N-acetylglucosamine 1-carboxyvinyltransferase [Chloroflexota bacterium]
MTRLLQVEGGRPLNGEVRTAGSKNAALPIMAACLLTREPCRLRNVPFLADVDNALEILAGMGVKVTREDADVSLDASVEPSSEVPQDRARRMRASILFMGPLLARTGRAVVPKPGGDDIGMRRVDQHVYGLVQLGARVEEDHSSFVCTAENGLRGAEINLDMPTVTGTENLLMAATIAEGRTTIINAAREPHVADLAAALKSMGAEIRGAGTDRIEIEGGEKLHGIDHRVTSDYLEAGTYAIAAAAAGGDVYITDAPVEDLGSLVLKLRHAGVDVETGENWLRVKREGPLTPVDLITWTHPGFATDLQPQYTALMTQARGTSVIQEFLFENRFSYIGELRRMGAEIELAPHGRSIRVAGPTGLHGAGVAVPDIRSGAALLIAALCAQGTSRLSGVEHLERGYEDMTGKLSRLGSQVEEVQGDPDPVGGPPAAME